MTTTVAGRVDVTPDPNWPEDGRTVGWWHRLWMHRWSPWSTVFSAGSLFSKSGPWWQSRRCVVCGREDRRRVEMGPR